MKDCISRNQFITIDPTYIYKNPCKSFFVYSTPFILFCTCSAPAVVLMKLSITTKTKLFHSFWKFPWKRTMSLFHSETGTNHATYVNFVKLNSLIDKSEESLYAYKRSVVNAFKELQEISPIYKYVGDPSLVEAVEAIGEVYGKDILDFGCGLGMYSRMFAEKGAKFILGTDISEYCIEVAQQKEMESETKNPIQYMVADCGEPSLNLGHKFDLGLCFNVFHYAKDEATLYCFAKNLFNHIKPNGAVVISLLNGEYEWDYSFPMSGRKKYRFNLCKPSPIAKNSDVCKFHFTDSNGESMLNVQYYHYCNSTYEGAMKEAGFNQLMWGVWKVSKEGRDCFPEGFWNEYDDSKLCTILTARKPGT